LEPPGRRVLRALRDFKESRGPQVLQGLLDYKGQLVLLELQEFKEYPVLPERPEPLGLLVLLDLKA
jgi:hypothetical protein